MLAGDWKLVPGPFMILLKWQYSEIWLFWIVTFNILKCPLFTFSKKMKHWNCDIIGYRVLGAGCLIEKNLELSPSPPDFSKDSWKLLPLLISIHWPSLVTSWVVVQKIYPKMHPVSCINTHHHITDFANNGMVKNTKT